MYLHRDSKCDYTLYFCGMIWSLQFTVCTVAECWQYCIESWTQWCIFQVTRLQEQIFANRVHVRQVDLSQWQNTSSEGDSLGNHLIKLKKDSAVTKEQTQLNFLKRDPALTWVIDTTQILKRTWLEHFTWSHLSTILLIVIFCNRTVILLPFNVDAPPPKKKKRFRPWKNLKRIFKKKKIMEPKTELKDDQQQNDEQENNQEQVV